MRLDVDNILDWGLVGTKTMLVKMLGKIVEMAKR